MDLTSTLHPEDPNALDEASRGEGGTHVRSRKPRRERKAACTSCRQQKLKCDAHLNPDKPCSRCSKFGLSCVQSPGFQGSRVRSAQRSRQTDFTENNGQEESHQGNARPGIPATFERERRPIQAPTPATSTELSNPSNFLVSSNSATESRTLSGIQVDGKIVDECFQIFFQHYAPLLPIFTSPLVPNSCYKSCPTLFWAIVVVGSRSLISDPTLLRALPPEVNTLALTSFQMRRNRIGEIRALLLLCTWSCPGTTMLRDNTVALSGLLLSLAMQAGLHVPNSHYGLLTGPGSESRANRQSEKTILWTHIVIVYQSIMSLGGYPSMVPLPYYSLERIPQQSIPPELIVRFKAQSIVSESESIITDLGLDASFPHEQVVVLARIQPFLIRLDNLEAEFSSMKESHLHIQIARLQLEVLQFYCKTDLSHQAELTKLFCTASSVLTSIKALNDTTSITSYAPSYLSMSLSLAAFTLLRMMKSSFVDLLSPVIIENGKSSFFVTIHMLKQMSLVNNDLCAKSAELLSSMWTDQTIFKTSDSSSWWKLRIRNRLSMTIVFDSILVWIEEHGCDNMDAHRHSYELEAEEGLDITQPGNNELSPFLGDGRWLYELDWNASLDVLLAEQN